MMNKIKILSFVVISVVMSISAQAETQFAIKTLSGVPFDSIAARTVVKRGSQSGEEKDLFQINRGTIGDLIIAPSWDMIAVRANVQDVNYPNYFQSNLMIYDTTGIEQFDSKLEAQFFSFSKDGTKLAILTAHNFPWEKDLSNYTTGIGIIDISSGVVDWIVRYPDSLKETVEEMRLIHSIEEHPLRWLRNILWAPDGGIYLVGMYHLFRVNIETHEITKTRIPGHLSGGMSISPDGQHILRMPYYNYNQDSVSQIFDIYSLKSELRIDEFVDGSFGRVLRWPEYEIGVTGVNWFGGEGSILYVEAKAFRTESKFHELRLLNLNDKTVRYVEPNPSSKFRIWGWKTYPGSNLYTRYGQVLQFSKEKLLSPITPDNK